MQVHEEDDSALFDRLAAVRGDVETQVRRRIVGMDTVVERMLIALFARGHSLFVGVPGLAKTLLVASTARALGLSSARVQFTPDLLPADITGTDVLHEDRATGTRELRFSPGPVFTHLLLADEVNRAPPRTQAALLQAMQEGQVTSGRTTHALPDPFLVFATQNPIEQEGTYPLPEAQLDRFMFSIDVAYPTEAEEVEVVERTTAPAGPEPEAVVQREELLRLQALVRRLPCNDDVTRFAVRLARATRPGADALPLVRQYVQWGAGPRASQYLAIGARVRAALHGRLAPDQADVRAVAPAVLAHRVLPNFAAEAEGVSAASIVAQVLAQVADR
jgi:MoxR-like ATPase